MNKIKTIFSIKDLENLSGIKAHTIRIWEKRYSLFHPERSDTNIRYYSLESLQKILNISYLNKNGYKVSKIAMLSSKEMISLAKELSETNRHNNHVLNSLKLSMFSFNKQLFNDIFNELIQEFSFGTIFYSYLIPFLDDIGFLWQTNTITPAHEHFITELIKQKILVYTEKAPVQTQETEITYVLFLPENEIHEIGLLYLNYELTARGFNSIYLGQSVPINSLIHLKEYYKTITFISAFTVNPEPNIINKYLTEINKTLLKNTNNSLYISGRLTQHIDKTKLDSEISVFNSSKAILDEINNNTLKLIN